MCVGGVYLLFLFLFLFLLTATPTPNEQLEIFSQFS